MESVENEQHVFHPSHRAWKTRQTAPSFPQFPQPLLLEMFVNKRKRQLLMGQASAQDCEHSLPASCALKRILLVMELVGAHSNTLSI